ncbi:MAG TPA: ABC transporter permease [Chromatiales bacterium]|nr:ABC transporter permease [Chromatiales bacterium]
MRPRDHLGFTWQALIAVRLRTLLVTGAAAIGVAAVVILTALGEGARLYILGEFSQLGSELLVVLPGKSEKGGGPPGAIIETERDLTLGDVEALRRLPRVTAVSPLSVGVIEASVGAHSREATLLGSDASFEQTRKLRLARGEFIPPADLDEALAVAIIGPTLASELFGNASPLGQWMRLGDRRFRVIGVLEAQGTSLGQNLNESVIVPVASAQALFDNPALFRILIQVESRGRLPGVEQAATRLLTQRHQGEEDFTLVTQDAVLTTFDAIFGVLTLSVAGIAGISLLVAGIIIMNVMLVSVSQRRAEIGLLKALGAPPGLILRLFLLESLLIGLFGALAGSAFGQLGVLALGTLYPAFPVTTPTWAYLAAAATALGAGLLFGWLPARRAARLDPVRALTGK